MCVCVMENTSVEHKIENGNGKKRNLLHSETEKGKISASNKLVIHTHVNFRPHNAMFLLLNNYVFPDWQR